MAMSLERMRELADAEDQYSVAAGAYGTNLMLLDYYRWDEARKASLKATAAPEAPADRADASSPEVHANSVPEMPSENAATK